MSLDEENTKGVKLHVQLHVHVRSILLLGLLIFAKIIAKTFLVFNTSTTVCIMQPKECLIQCDK